MKLEFFTIGFIVFLAFLLPAILALGIRYIPYDIQPRLDNYEEVHRYQVISQSFTAQADDLSGFALSLKNPVLRNKKDINLILTDVSDTEIRKTTLNGTYIQDGEYVKFIFTPIRDSKGKKYTFTFSAPNVEKNESLAVFYTFNKPDWAGELRIGDRLEQNGSVSFVGLYSPATVFTPAIDIYSNWFGRFVADSMFFLFYLALVLTLSIYVLFLSIKTSRE